MTAAKRLRIPTRIELPFGYTVRVKQLHSDEYDQAVDEGSLACWIVEERTVYLRKDRTLKQRRADFAHEMGHVFMDWQENILGSKHSDLKS